MSAPTSSGTAPSTGTNLGWLGTRNARGSKAPKGGHLRSRLTPIPMAINLLGSPGGHTGIRHRGILRRPGTPSVAVARACASTDGLASTNVTHRREASS